MWSHRKYFLFLSLTIDPMTRATLIPAGVAESLRWVLLAGIDRIDLSGGSCREDRVCTVLGVFSCLSNRVLFVVRLLFIYLFFVSTLFEIVVDACEKHMNVISFLEIITLK